MIILLVSLVVVIIGCIIRTLNHSEAEAKFDVKIEDMTSVEIEGDHYLIYFNASAFPSESSDANATQFFYYPLVIFSDSRRVKKGDEIAKIKIMREMSNASPSTGSYSSESVFRVYTVNSPYDGVVTPRYGYSKYMTDFILCELKPGTEEEENIAAKTAVLEKYGIGERYYNDIAGVTLKLGEFKKSLGLNVSALDAIDAAYAWQDEDKDQHAMYLIMIDALRCFEGLGTPVSLDTKEGFALIALTWSLMSNEEMPKYEDLWKFYELASGTAGFIQSVKHFADEAYAKDTLALPDVLAKFDYDLRDKYFVLLFRWASIVANVDGTLTEQEKSWLARLTSLRAKSPRNVIYLIVDKCFIEAAECIVKAQKGSASYIQRYLSLGFARASRIMGQLEEAGIVGPATGATSRSVNVKSLEELDKLLDGMQLEFVEPYSSASEAKSEQVAPKRISPTLRSGNPMAKLERMIGLSSVKEDIKTLYNFVKVQQMRQESGMKTSSVSFHCVFTGNPGTGKTTVARIVAEIYRDLGILKKGHLVETDRSGLVAEYVGQTAVKTNKIIDSALDGVLFIDEAYSLSEGGQGDFGKEAIATLLKRMEDDRYRLVVILAGYSSNMKDFIDTNPGLQSRFNRYIDFPDYTVEELYEIFLSNIKKSEYVLSGEAQARLKSIFERAVAEKDINFGNGRYVRNIFEKTIQRQANRLSKEKNITPDMLALITEADFPCE